MKHAVCMANGFGRQLIVRANNMALFWIAPNEDRVVVESVSDAISLVLTNEKYPHLLPRGFVQAGSLIELAKTVGVTLTEITDYKRGLKRYILA